MGIFDGAAFGGMFGGGPGAAAGGYAGSNGFNPAGLFYHQNTPFHVDPGEKPTYAGYTSIRGPNGLLSSPDLNQQYGPSIANNLNTQGMDEFRKETLAGPGNSPWEQMMRARQGLEQQGQANQAMQNAASRGAEARSQIAAHGGLTSGAAERMAKFNSRGAQSGLQDVYAQGAKQRADIATQAEQNRMSNLSKLPEMELQQLNPQFQERGMQLGTQQFNIQNALAQKQAEEAAKMADYQQKMQAWAAANQANAIAASGPQSGGLFGQSGLLGGLFG